MGNEKIGTRVNTVWLGADGIARVIHVSGAEVMQEGVQDAFAAHLTIRQGKRHPLLVDARKLRSFSGALVNFLRARRSPA